MTETHAIHGSRSRQINPPSPTGRHAGMCTPHPANTRCLIRHAKSSRVCACARRYMHSFCHVLDLHVHRRCYQNMMKAWADDSSDEANPSADTTLSYSWVSTTPRPRSCALSRHALCFPNVGDRACLRDSSDLFPPRTTSDSFFSDPISSTRVWTSPPPDEVLPGANEAPELALPTAAISPPPRSLLASCSGNQEGAATT